MAPDQVKTVLRFLNATWTQKPFDKDTASVWGSELARHDFDVVMKILRALFRTHEWRPSMAQILKPLLADAGAKGAPFAFSSIWDQIPKRPPKVTDLEAKAVEQLGGWDVLRGWQINERHFHYQRFQTLYRDIVADERSEQLRALTSGKQPQGLPPGDA